ncbi:Myc-type basic helix-loop-helix (bHLH) domain [Trinorchestia longiramus]|nr:Myc-type basic helix-loop-helix (bHLH) domain [Trinorchestia longiramus]
MPGLAARGHSAGCQEMLDPVTDRLLNKKVSPPELPRRCPHDQNQASTSSVLPCEDEKEELSSFTSHEKQPLKPNDSNNNKIHDENAGSSSSLSPEKHSKPTSINNRKVYGLRPRTGMKRVRCVSPEGRRETASLEPEEIKKSVEETSASAQNSSSNTQPPVVATAVAGAAKSKSSSKPRSNKSKPLSRYRRITANARERDRMKEINTAFATLRAVLPTFSNSRIASMTKYTTLQLAASYIKSLSDILNEAPASESENKKENCPTFTRANMGNITSNAPPSHQNVNLSVGISEIPFSKSIDAHSSQKSNDFTVFPSSLGSSNNFNDIPEEALGELGDINSLPDMCWTLDLMLE